MSATPRTDAVILWPDGNESLLPRVYADFARQLEIELSEAIKDSEVANGLYEKLLSHNIILGDEVAKLRQALEEIASLKPTSVGTNDYNSGQIVVFDMTKEIANKALKPYLNHPPIA